MQSVLPEVKRLLGVKALPRETLGVLLKWAIAAKDESICDDVIK